MALRKLFCVLIFGFFFVATTRCTKTPDSNFAPMDVKFNEPLFIFNTKNLTEFTIAKNDPTTSDQWTARLSKINSAPWEVASAPDGSVLADKMADASYIDHLADTLQTLRATAKAPNGPLSSFGLHPPRFALRWTASGKSHELLLGDSVPHKGGHYAWIGSQSTSGHVLIVQGAALQMLGYLTSFDALRLRKLLPFSADDVDELELYKGSRLFQYAQRQGDEWTDRKGQKLKAPVGEFLENLTHLRIRHFSDAIENSAPRAKPLFRLVFKDRHGKATVLNIYTRGGGVFAAVSSRPKSTFEVFSEALQILIPWYNQ
jgi:hypothetical protein